GMPAYRPLTDGRGVTQARLLDNRVLLDMTVPAHDAVRTDPRAGLDDDPIVEETGPFDGGAVLDPRAGRDPGRRRLGGEWFELVARIHHVAMDLPVFLGGADIDPVAAIDVGHECTSAFDQSR